MMRLKAGPVGPHPSAEWYADFSAPGDASVEGISFLSEERDGVTFTFTQVQD